MSVFDKFFKSNAIDVPSAEMNLLMKVTNNKMTLDEVKKVYSKIDSEVIKKLPRNVQIMEAMDMITALKGDYLTRNEKENFVAGVWMFDTLDTTVVKNQTYINEEQLKYVKQAVLGSQFEAARKDKYYAELREYQYKY